MNDAMHNLDQQIRDHYAGAAMSPRSLQRMRTAIAANRKQPAGLWRGLGIAAAVLLSLGVVLQVSRVESDHGRTWAMARQIASQHGQKFEPQVTADDFDDLKTMTVAGFTPVEPERCKQDDYRVVGARYQTVGGQQATQIRLAYVYGPPATLYEMPAEQFAWVREGTLNVDGLPVKFWREGNVLMALAGDASDPNNSRD